MKEDLLDPKDFVPEFLARKAGSKRKFSIEEKQLLTDEGNAKYQAAKDRLGFSTLSPTASVQCLQLSTKWLGRWPDYIAYIKEPKNLADENMCAALAIVTQTPILVFKSQTKSNPLCAAIFLPRGMGHLRGWAHGGFSACLMPVTLLTQTVTTELPERMGVSIADFKRALVPPAGYQDLDRPLLSWWAAAAIWGSVESDESIVRMFNHSFHYQAVFPPAEDRDTESES